MIMRKAILALLVLLAVVSVDAGFTSAQSDKPLLMQKPTLSKTSIVFSYAGYCGTVARKGGEATQLTNGVGLETDPVFSPDGTMVAFTGNYDGNTDVYVVPAAGGVPKRLTYHPAPDSAVGWTPDGKQVLFSSLRDSFTFIVRLYTIAVDGVFPTEVPLPMAECGSYSPDASRIAYEPITQWQPEWKRYKGGQTDRIWIARLSDSSIDKIPQEDSHDRNPIWIGDKIYFLSDRGNAAGTWTLWVYDTKTKKITQAINNNGFDIKSASACAGANPDAIIYEQFGSINLYDLKS